VKRWSLLLLAGLFLWVGSAVAEPLRLNEIYRALEAHRYDEVEATYADLRRSRERNEEGDFLFESFLRYVPWASSLDPADGSYWPKVDEPTQAWVTHSPNSYLAAMVRAFALAYHAGSVQAHKGSWTEVDRIAAEARRLMDQSKEAGWSDPMWHAINLRVAAVEGAPRSDVRGMVLAAAAVDPYPLRLWQEAALALSPDGRNLDDQTWLMRLAVQRTRDTEGTAMYARVLNVVYWHFCDCVPGAYGRAGVEWSLLNPSFEEWKVRYPRAYSIDLHAATACLARDGPATARLLQQIRNTPRKEIWELMGGTGLFKRCQEMTVEPEDRQPRAANPLPMVSSSLATTRIVESPGLG
jgi:hypothetical protein